MEKMSESEMIKEKLLGFWYDNIIIRNEMKLNGEKKSQ